MVFSFFHRWLSHTRTAPAPEALPPQGIAADAEVEFLQGVRLASAPGPAPDYARAAECFQHAAEQNHRLAQFNLAIMYDQGQGVVRDEGKSLMWMRKAADAGDAGAQYRLGVREHLASRRGPKEAAPEGRIEALKWVRLSADQGYRGAQGACEFVALGMTREEVTEGGKRAAAFVAAKPG